MVKRILVIDDEDDIREVIAMSLEITAGWDVLSVGSGEEGLDCAARELPDAVLLDIALPGLDGFGILARLKGNPQTAPIPVIMLTASVLAGRRGTPPEASGSILKPFDPLRLAAEIANMLGWPQPVATGGS